MSVSYTCPNPECGVTLKTPNRVPAGKSVKCPKCGKLFVPESESDEAAAVAAIRAAEDEAKKAPAKPAPAAPAAPPKKSPFADEDEESDESIKKGYGVVKETEAEIEAAEKNKPSFTEVQDKFKKSARGPAQALLVMPSNLMLGAGLILCVASVGYFVVGLWPLVFNDAPPGEEELDEAVFGMLLGTLGFVWGGMICYGASQMQELASYIWAMLGSIMSAPLLVGIFGIIMLMNPKVKEGFEEAEAGPDEDDEDDDDDDDDEEEADDEDDDKGGGKAKKTAKKAAKKLGRGLLKGVVGGDGDDE
jgi:hypothetical protein